MISDNIEIRTLAQKDLPQALFLVREVFFQFEAPEYSVQGIREFCNFLDDPAEIAQLTFYGAFSGRQILGVLAMRGFHISLFFVHPAHHRHGLGRSLFDAARQKIPNSVLTVNSSPYAVEIYRRLGFHATDCEQVTNGIRYIPMSYRPSSHGN